VSKNSGTPPKPGAPDPSIEFNLTTPPRATSSVLNEANETIGKIDDLLVTPDVSQLILLAVFAVGMEPMQKAGAIGQTPGKRPNPSRAQGDIAG
jgi:hypothetical protein